MTTNELTEAVASRFYLDCEFDGHNGPLLSLALVREDGRSIHIRTTEQASDPWVIANVIPIMDSHEAGMSQWVPLNEVGPSIRAFIGDCENPTIIADSPVDIGRFCRAISTGPDGEWASADCPSMSFEVRNIDCYPTNLEGAVQHNAWWDATALQAAVRAHDAANGLRLVKGEPVAEIERLRLALSKVMPIRVHDGPDYAEVFFADGVSHSTQAMTMNPQDWRDIAAAINGGE